MSVTPEMARDAERARALALGKLCDRQAIRLDRVRRVLSDFDALTSRRKTAVNPREFADAIRRALNAD